TAAGFRWKRTPVWCRRSFSAASGQATPLALPLPRAKLEGRSMPDRASAGTRPGRLRAAALSVLLAAAGLARAEIVAPSRSTSPSPAKPWNPPPEATRPAEAAPADLPRVPERWLQPGATVSVAEVIDLALKNNPMTRSVWLDARAAAAHVESE